jgi:hypothetical protein
VIVGLSPSSSLAVAEQVSAVEVVTPLLGLTLTESTVGSVLSTVTLALSESVPLSESVAVAVQVMLSSGELVELVRVSVEPVPRLVEVVAFVHA